MRELAARALPLASADKDVVPRVAVHVDWPHYLWRRSKSSDGVVLTVVVGITLLSAGAVFVLMCRRKPGEQRPIATVSLDDARTGARFR